MDPFKGNSKENSLLKHDTRLHICAHTHTQKAFFFLSEILF